MDTQKIMETTTELLRSDLVIAPWLLNYVENTYTEAVLQVIDTLHQDASTFTQLCVKSKMKFDCLIPINERTLEEAYRVTAYSTAIYLSYLRLGFLSVQEEMFLVSKRILENFIRSVGEERFVELYTMQMVHENLVAIRYYTGVSIQSFISGDLHRPWSPNTLSDELHDLISQGLVHTTTDNGLVLTEQGEQTLEDITNVLRHSGYLSQRSQLMRLEKFNQMSDIEDILQVLTPGSAEQRQLLIDRSKVESQKVLELGCGSGALTFDSGLYRAVGSSGHLIASDPSVNMLYIAKQKKDKLQADWVEIVHAKAEDIPYQDNTFDFVIGCWFLHWTDIPHAVREIARVLKPGGIFSSVHALNYPVMHEFFKEWFEPLLSSVESTSKPDSLPTRETVTRELERYFQDVEIHNFDFLTYYTSPQTVVNFHVEIANTFQEQMESLPWRARNDMVKNLVRRGEDIVKKYPSDQLVEGHPAQFIQARK